MTILLLSGLMLIGIGLMNVPESELEAFWAWIKGNLYIRWISGLAALYGLVWALFY